MEKVTKQTIKELVQTGCITLSATQPRMCIPVINRIFKKMLAGIKFSPIKVEHSLICDGHHRYVASLLANLPIELIPGRSTSATVIIDWELVEFVDEDWDTAAKIKMLNEQDAEFNNMPVEVLTELLK